MNKHIRLVVSVLFVVIIILAIGITRLYVDISKNTGNSNSNTEIIRTLDVGPDGSSIFEGSGSLYGIAAPNGRVVVNPEWAELSFAGENLCIASKRINGKLLTGCIDCEGNLTVPLIYRNIVKKSADGFVFFAAEADSDGSLVLYDKDFVPLFLHSWDSYSVNGADITLERNSASFTYACTDSGLVCKNAEITGSVREHEFTLSIYSRLVLSNLSCPMLESISESVSAYIEYAFSGDISRLRLLISDSSEASFVPLFFNDDKVISQRLKSIDNIYIYSEKTIDGVQQYTVSFTVSADITYADEKALRSQLSGQYKASVKFIQTADGITPVSGAFLTEHPDYPSAEPEEEDQTVPGGNLRS